MYAIGFLAEWLVPKTINTGPEEPPASAPAIDLGLVLLFALQHTVMARAGFKRRLERVLPRPLEGSVFVLVSAMLLSLLLWQWRPLPETLWLVEQPALAAALKGPSLTGAGMVLYTTLLIDHRDLVGMRQAWAYYKQREPSHLLLESVRRTVGFVIR